MVNAAAVREIFRKRFDRVEDAGDGILRAERRYADKTFAVAYADLSDQVDVRANSIDTFQEKLLGAEFFAAEGDLRWNSYLFFLAGSESVDKSGYKDAKRKIENDRHYARKFVVTEDELASRLGVEFKESAGAKSVKGDVGADWARLLRDASLGVLLDQKPRTQAMELIANGQAFVAETPQIAAVAPSADDPLRDGALRKLTINKFRKVNDGRSFSFGDVNLIFGQNGSGKTSLLEAIEILYCGRVRRDAAASFSGIEASILTKNGNTVQVSGTTTPAALKARNRTWYGRADPQSSAISQGFTRFNFLDTDAAFRLSSASDSSAETIKEDLSRLLVGPETSKLWTYISKLEQELKERLKGIDTRLPILRQQSQYLAADIKRFRESPTEANALLKTFRSSLEVIGATWGSKSEDLLLDREDRARLEKLSRGLGQVITNIQLTPMTYGAVLKRKDEVREVVCRIKVVCEELTSNSNSALANLANKEEQSIRLGALATWIRYCDAGVPSLIESLSSIDDRMSSLRRLLAGQSLDFPPEIAPEYSSLPIAQGLEIAAHRLDDAQESEKTASTRLQQSQQFEQSIASLTKQLHDTAKSILERTGDSSHCPVCKTPHDSSELMMKIDSLIEIGARPIDDDLHRALSGAKDRIEQERRSHALLKRLETFHAAAGMAVGVATADILAEVSKCLSDVSEVNSERERVLAALDSISSLGLDGNMYETSKNAASGALSDSAVLGDLNTVQEERDLLAESLVFLQEQQATLQKAQAELTEQIDELMSQAQIDFRTRDPFEALKHAEKLESQLDSAVEFLVSSKSLIAISEERSLNELHSVIDQAMVAFDRAEQAEISEKESRKELDGKVAEHESVSKMVVTLAQEREFVSRASASLENIVVNFSLEEAMKDTLDSIRGRVGSIFNRIHSPSEYLLGDFDDESLLVSKDGDVARGINQVSTGQRAALALSIFLGLNDSAESAPPVIMIDDPVAHIDDLNTLSFLDYLRDLVVSSKKQVFFATADARLAALFERKFEFLGESRFKKHVLAR